MSTAGRAAEERAAKRRRIEATAAEQRGVISRRQLYDAGVTRAEVRANVRAGRWRRVGDHVIAVHRAALSPRALHAAALLEAGPRAHLDGASSLIDAGLRGFDAGRIRVSVPRGTRMRRRRRGWFDIRETRRFDPAEVVEDPLARTRNSVGAVRGALWAKTQRQGALLLSMAVQQKLVEPEELAQAMLAIKRDKRRAFLHGVIGDLMGGATSLGELDFARECRRRGLPEPSRQVLRRGRGNRYYLDVYWPEFGVVVEIDGIQHGWVENAVADAVRHNEVALSRDIVLRLPLLGLRVEPDTFFEQVADALRQGGWPGPLVAA